MTKEVSSPKELRNFGLVLAGLFLLFAAGIPYLKRHQVVLWPWALAVVLTILALLAPKTLKPVMIAWTKLGHIMGAINTRIILGFFYFFVLFPMAVFARISGKDRLGRRYRPDLKSYRVKSRESDIKQMERIF